MRTDEEIGEFNQRQTVIYVCMWAALIIAAAAVSIYKALHFTIINGLEPYDILLAGAPYAFLAMCLALIAPICVSPKYQLASFFTFPILTLLAAWIVGKITGEIEFRRTPPCVGMNSIEIGSGSGCPAGMTESMTFEEIRDWYHKNHRKPRAVSELF